MNSEISEPIEVDDLRGVERAACPACPVCPERPERTIRKVPLTDYREARAFFERIVGRKYGEEVASGNVVRNTNNGPF